MTSNLPDLSGVESIGKTLAVMLATGLAVYKAVLSFLRHQLKHYSANSGTDRITAERQKPEESELSSEFFVKVLQPAIEDRQKEYGRRLSDMRQALDDHLQKAEIYMAKVHVLESAFTRLERLRETDKQEILTAVDRSETRIADRLDNLTNLIVNGKNHNG